MEELVEVFFPFLVNISMEDSVFLQYEQEQPRYGEPELEGITRPVVGNSFKLDPAVEKALPVLGIEVIDAFKQGTSLWGRTAKVICRTTDGKRENYFLKMLALGELGKKMTSGEYESLKVMRRVSPTFCTKPHAWGQLQKASEVYFLLAEWRDIGEQPPDPIKFTARLAEMHRNSTSPTEKFGFHITTYHSSVRQYTDVWEDSWTVLFRKQLGLMISLDRQKNQRWPEFEVLCVLTLYKVVARLLDALVSENRRIKPCLIHGALWDENAAIDMNTGEPFIFDGGSFYGHNEYEIGNWRTPRHRMSNKVYSRNYKRKFPVSEPEEEWDDRNLLYSLRYELHGAIIFPGSKLRQSVYNGMLELCSKLFPMELKTAVEELKKPGLQRGNEDETISGKDGK